MKALIGLTFSLMAGACLAAETYKWVDDKGVVNYGEKPPASRPARPVNTNPGAVVETGGQFGQKAETEKRRAGEDFQRPQYAAAPVPAPAPSSPSARGMDFDIYIRLQRGMTEGELLLRAGRPDYESLDNLYDFVKTYYYFPTTFNPYTTVVTVRGGRVFELDRIKKF